MSQHMVIFQNPDGHPGYNQFDSVDDAVVFVEKIRNEQGIDSIRIFELNEVKFELKPYFKVELQALNPGTAAATERSPQPSSTPDASRPSAPAGAVTSPPTSSSASAPATPSAPSNPPAPSSPSAPNTSSGSDGPAKQGAPDSPFAPPSGAPQPGTAAGAGAPIPPADQPASDDQPTRRGLFGR